MILISILGDFHSSVLPIFYNFKDTFSKHVLVYDDARKDVNHAMKINKGIHKFRKKNNYTFLELQYKLDEDSLVALEKCAEYILNLTNNPHDIYVNTTDGYSTLTTILNHKLFSKGVNFIAYDRYDNQYNLLNEKGLQTKNIQYNLNIVEHFLLKGYKIETSNIKIFAHKNEKQIKKLFQRMSKEYDEFIKLDPAVYPKISDLRGRFKDIKELLLEMDENFLTLSTKNALFTGGFFECYIYLLIKDMGFDDIEIGLEIFRKYKNSFIRNEFDILVMKNNHLHMIECKYKNFIKMEELVYKYIALADVIDDDGKMAIVTKKAPKYDTKIDISEEQGLTYKRGRLNNIFFYGNIPNNQEKFKKEMRQLFDIEG